MNLESLDSNICLSAVGHDPQGSWVDHLTNSNNVLTQLYDKRILSLSDRTHNSTVLNQ